MYKLIIICLLSYGCRASKSCPTYKHKSSKVRTEVNKNCKTYGNDW